MGAIGWGPPGVLLRPVDRVQEEEGLLDQGWAGALGRGPACCQQGAVRGVWAHERPAGAPLAPRPCLLLPPAVLPPTICIAICTPGPFAGLATDPSTPWAHPLLLLLLLLPGMLKAGVPCLIGPSWLIEQGQGVGRGGGLPWLLLSCLACLPALPLLSLLKAPA
ncbi:hypothetical protein V8C86DRAFT_2513931 [Haematococcus lacustris]